MQAQDDHPRRPARTTNDDSYIPFGPLTTQLDDTSAPIEATRSDTQVETLEPTLRTELLTSRANKLLGQDPPRPHIEPPTGSLTVATIHLENLDEQESNPAGTKKDTHLADGSNGPNTGRFRSSLVLICAILSIWSALLGTAGGYWAAQRTFDRAASSSDAPSQAGNGSFIQEGTTTGSDWGSLRSVAGLVSPTVVQIDTEGGGSGSGFFIRQDGYVLTNSHVIASDTDKRVTVTLADGRRYKAKLVGRDVSYDLAVLKVPATNLSVAPLGDTRGARVGDPVIAIGSPLGLQGTVTFGIISSVHRPVTAGGTDETSYIDALQTDAAINPGNSGGPLVSLDGRVIGVNSAIASTSGSQGSLTGSIGLGFAIPIDQAKRVADQIVHNGRSSHPVAGVQVALSSTDGGARLSAVTRSSPADKAGLRRGDVITDVDGRPVRSATDLIVAIRARAPGDELTMTVRRGERIQQVKMVLAAD